MSYDGVIFDLDGTLINSLEDIANAANATLRRYDLNPHPVDSYRYFIGDGLQTLIERIIPQLHQDLEFVTMLMATFKELYSAGWHNKSSLYEGIGSMLNSLEAKGIKLAVFSNKPHHFTELFVERFFPATTFAYVQGQVSGLAKKPDPAGAVMIAKQLRLREERMVFVGDTAIDIETGSRAGMKTIGVEWGFRDRLELEKSGADKIVQRPREVADYVLESKDDRLV